MQKVFEALASQTRRKILAFLGEGELTAGQIADRFEISKPSISQHLSVLENAGLVESDKRGQFVHYRLRRDSLINALDGLAQEVCPVRRPIRKEAKARDRAKPASGT